MFLRSGTLGIDAGGIYTLEAFLDERQIMPAGNVDPIPIVLFQTVVVFSSVQKIDVRQDLVVDLAKPGARFEAMLDQRRVDRCRRGRVRSRVRQYANLPDWAASIPDDGRPQRLTLFIDQLGERVLIVGGRQSAHEWVYVH